jgi:hypothetical protein
MGRRLRRILRSEQLETRRPLAADLAALDVNDDLQVTALDALIIINELNQPASNGSGGEAEGQPQCDTNSDGIVSPLDVLNVVNQINSGVVAVSSDTTDDTAPPVTSPDDSASDDSDATDPSDTVDDGADSGDDVISLPTDGTDDSTGDDTSGDDTSDDDTSDDDTSDDDTSDDDTSNDDTSDDDTSDDDTSDPGEDVPECDHGHRAPEFARVPIGGERGELHLPSRGHHAPGDLFDALDKNGDGTLSSDEVPEALWEHLSAADADGDDAVTKEEVKAYLEAQRVAAIEAFFERLDADASGAITSTEVSRLEWHFLSRADANSDGSVTVEELLAVPAPGRWGGH